MSMLHPLCPSSPKPAQSTTTTAAALTLTPPLPKTWKDIISMLWACKLRLLLSTSGAMEKEPRNATAKKKQKFVAHT
jgi:hypothetical protein